MPLLAHLTELRARLIRMIAAVSIAAGASYYFADALFAFLTTPLMQLNTSDAGLGGVRLIGTGVVEAFFTKLKVAVIAGIFLSSPVLLHQIWQFVAPGLYETEKRYMIPFVSCGTLFFLFGAGFCYTSVLPVGYHFFIEQYATIGVAPEIRISEYLTFTARMLLAFSITFELPVVTFFLARIGLVTHTWMIHHSRYAVLVIFILAAVLTPGPDIASQLLLAGPLLLLYGMSIGVAWLVARERAVPPASE